MWGERKNQRNIKTHRTMHSFRYQMLILQLGISRNRFLIAYQCLRGTATAFENTKRHLEFKL